MWAKLLADEWKEQNDRKISLEQRGLAVISTSAALITLILALSAITVPRPTNFSVAAKIVLVTTLALFVLSALLGLAVMYPRLYPEFPLDELRLMVSTERWTETDNMAAWRVAQARVGMVGKALELNGGKAVLLSWALAAEVLGIVSTAVSVVLIST